MQKQCTTNGRPCAVVRALPPWPSPPSYAALPGVVSPFPFPFASLSAAVLAPVREHRKGERYYDIVADDLRGVNKTTPVGRVALQVMQLRATCVVRGNVF